jgi:predicted GTPase
MSQIEENTEVVFSKNPSFWEKLINVHATDYSKYIDDREDHNDKVVRIAVVGQTGVGKGSFINAIRGFSNFKINPAKVTHGALPGPLIIESFGYPDDESPIIYFYDTGGFGDAYNKNYKLEEKLNQYQKDNKIKFDAIIFLLQNRFLEHEIQPLKDQENKVCLVLYVVNKIDLLKNAIQTDEEFKKEIEETKRKYLEILKKNQVNKHELSEKSIYLISSTIRTPISSVPADLENENISPEGIKLIKELMERLKKSNPDFEDEFWSPDGNRIKTELMELLLKIKIGEPLDLFNSHSRQLISYKAKCLKNMISKNAYKSSAKTSLIAIIPIADIFVQNKVVSSYKEYFLEEFSIKRVLDSITNNEDIIVSDANIISKGTEKWINIKTIVDEINSNQILEALKLIFKKEFYKELTKEKIKASFNALGGVCGRLMSTFSDDILVACTKLSGGALQVGSIGLKIFGWVITIVTFPIAIALYIKFCHMAIMKAVDEIADYAIKICDVLHEKKDNGN